MTPELGRGIGGKLESVCVLPCRSLVVWLQWLLFRMMLVCT